MNKSIQLYVWPQEYVDADKASKEFSPVVLEYDVKAAIGAGASGPCPELNLLLIVAGSTIVYGFLEGIGEDLWKVLKKGVSKFAIKKPAEEEFSKLGYHLDNVYYELIFWIYFDDIKILVLLHLSSEKETYHALDLLPVAIDEAVKSGEEFCRLVWSQTTWERY